MLIRLVLAVIILCGQALGATYYCSQGGTGTTCSEASPCKIASVWSKVVDGDTVILEDGEYTGSTSMLQPTSNVNGSNGNPITVRARNDGAVRINGGSTIQRPVWLDYSKNNHYFVIEGINVQNGLDITIDVSATGCVMRRVIAWDSAVGAEAHQVWLQNGWNTLVEDCAAFGNGRYTFGGNQMGQDSPNPKSTFRRVFTVFHGSTFTLSNPKASMLYWYQSDPTIWENCIGTWDNATVSHGQGIIFAAAASPYVHGSTATELYGMIAYLKASQGAVASMSAISAQFNRKIKITNSVGYLDPAETAASILPLDFRAHSDTGDASDMTLTNVTGIGANASNIHSDWTQTNVNTATSVANAYPAGQSLWRNDGAHGATISGRYVDGVRTNAPLFPWPMNARIIAAMTLAGYTAIDVNADMKAIFGTIPTSGGMSAAF